MQFVSDHCSTAAAVRADRLGHTCWTESPPIWATRLVEQTIGGHHQHRHVVDRQFHLWQRRVRRVSPVAERRLGAVDPDHRVVSPWHQEAADPCAGIAHSASLRIDSA